MGAFIVGGVYWYAQVTGEIIDQLRFLEERLDAMFEEKLQDVRDKILYPDGPVEKLLAELKSELEMQMEGVQQSLRELHDKADQIESNALSPHEREQRRMCNAYYNGAVPLTLDIVQGWVNGQIFDLLTEWSTASFDPTAPFADDYVVAFGFVRYRA